MVSGVLFSVVPPSILNYDKAAIHSKHFVYKLLWGGEKKESVVSVTCSVVGKAEHRSY